MAHHARRQARLARLNGIRDREPEPPVPSPDWDELDLDDPDVEADVLMLVDAEADPLARVNAFERLLAGSGCNQGADAVSLVEDAALLGEHVPKYVRHAAEAAPRASHLGVPTPEVLAALAEIRARYSGGS